MEDEMLGQQGMEDGKRSPDDSVGGDRLVPGSLARISSDLIRGDLIQVKWMDITEDPVGNPDKPVPSHRHSIGLFWGRGVSGGLPVLVTTTTLEMDEAIDSSGYCAYPEGAIVEVRMIKRKRRPRKVKKPNG